MPIWPMSPMSTLKAIEGQHLRDKRGPNGIQSLIDRQLGDPDIPVRVGTKKQRSSGVDEREGHHHQQRQADECPPAVPEQAEGQLEHPADVERVEAARGWRLPIRALGRWRPARPRVGWRREAAGHLVHRWECTVG